MANENDALQARVKAVLAGTDGVPEPSADEALAILENERAQVLHVIQTFRLRHRIASVHVGSPGGPQKLAEIEDLVGRNLVTLDAIDAELSKVHGK